MSTCDIKNCERETLEKFCTHHQIGWEAVNSGFEEWQKALGEDLTWENYLIQLIEDDAVKTGDIAVDVAIFELEKISDKKID